MRNLKDILTEGFYKNAGNEFAEIQEWLETLKEYLTKNRQLIYRYNVGGIRKEFLINPDPDNLRIVVKDAASKSDRRNFIIDLKDSKISKELLSAAPLEDLQSEAMDSLFGIYLTGDPNKVCHTFLVRFWGWRADVNISFDWKTRKVTSIATR